MSDKNCLRQEVLLEMDFLKSMGTKNFVFPFIGKQKKEMIGYFIIYALVLCTALQLFLTLCSYSSKDYLEVINVAPNLGVVVMTVIKYTKIQTHKEVYDEIYYHFRDDMWNIVSSDTLSHQKIIRRYKWVTMVINRFLLYYSIPLTIVVDSFPYLVTVYEQNVNNITDQYLYPFDGWYPFDKVKWYAAAYLWESCMTAVVVCVYGFSNMIHTSYITFICMELRIIGNCLEELISTEDGVFISAGRDTCDINLTIKRKLKILIAKHEYLAQISANLDAILGDAMLLNYSLGSIFICLTAFTSTVCLSVILIIQQSRYNKSQGSKYSLNQVGIEVCYIEVVDNLYKSVRYFFMFTSLLVEIFTQCFIGQVLSDHSENVTNSIYSCNWTCPSPEVKKIMLLFLMRTQKPFELTGHGYIAMNMNTFSSIISTSYQLFNLLRTVYV